MKSFLLLGLVFAPTVVAQSSAGPFVGLPLHGTVLAGTLGPAGSPLAPNDLYLKRAGFVDVVPAPAFAVPPPPYPPKPRFTKADMFPGVAAGFRIDALSSGYCRVWATYDMDGDPVLDLGPNEWGALLFGVTQDSPGIDTPAVAFEHTRPDGAGGDVFSLVLPGSLLPSSLDCVPIGVAQRASDSSEMGFQTMPGQKPELRDFDPFFSFYECEGSILAYLQPEPYVYFSVPSVVAPSVATWFQTRNGMPLASGTVPSGATILRMRWSTGADMWGPPDVFLTYEELGLLVNDDIDALAVEETGRVLLSLKRTPTRTLVGEQLMVASFAFGGPVPTTIPARTYYYVDDGTDGTKVELARIAGAKGSGGTAGDIDGTCEIDPSNSNGSTAHVFGYVRDCRSDIPLPTTMAASVIATAPEAPGLSTVAVSLAGAQNLSGLSVAALLAGPPAPGGGPLIDFVLLAAYLVTDGTETHRWSTPATIASLGLDLDFQWLTLDGPALKLATVVRFRF